MHDTAYEHGRLFFELYWSNDFSTVVDLGSQDVNGSLRDHCPTGVRYIGLDMIVANGVDVVVDPGNALPIASDSVDAAVTTSAFEHDVCFWDTFLELVRIVRPGGLIYVNAPSNHAFHRYPLDCWRFYPDAGVALVRWAQRRSGPIELVESFVAQPKNDGWADFVAVFRKAGEGEQVRRGRIADRTRAINIHDHGMRLGASLEAETPYMPDMRNALELERALADRNAELEAAATARTAELETARTSGEAQIKAAAHQNAMLSTELSEARARHEQLGREVQASAARIAELENSVAETKAQLAAARKTIETIYQSTSWRMTDGLRRLVALGRGR